MSSQPPAGAVHRPLPQDGRDGPPVRDAGPDGGARSGAVPDREPTYVEVLAPAGSREAFAAALGSGADAVYLGLAEGFNARARSDAFDRDALPDLVAQAHRARAKLYLTLNTLVFEGELQAARDLLVDVARAGVDAIIVQDPAVALLARALCPQLRVHASTQMTISSVEGARFAAGLGVCRVVLPRELSVAEIARFVADSPLQAEVFAHGALCMAWSGQCLTSEALSDRSANRGQCSQACRMPYDLVVDGQRRDLGDVRYLLSPQDLAAHGLVGELMAAGVHCLKIEGRYKNATYVAMAVDALSAARDLSRASHRAAGEPARVELQRRAWRSQLTFSRGGSTGFLRGDDHQALVLGQTPKHRGLPLGTVRAVDRKQVRVAVDDVAAMRELLRPGVGVLFEVGDPEANDAPGGPVFGVQWQGDALTLSFGVPGPDLRRIGPGTSVRLTGDPELAREAARRCATPTGRTPLYLDASGQAGAKLRVAARGQFAGRSLGAAVESESRLQPARGAGLDGAVLRDKLGGLGGTPFHLAQLDVGGLSPGLHLSVAELKRMRRALVAQLTGQLEHPVRPLVQPLPDIAGLRAELARDVPPEPGDPRLVPLCRTAEQLQAVIECGAGPEVELDFMELVGLRQAVQAARAAGLRVTLATVRVQKPGEEGYDRRLRALRPDAVLVRHWGGVMGFAEAAAQGRDGDGDAGAPHVHGDFSLNVSNSLTALYVLRLGLRTVTASHDLNRPQLLQLLRQTPAGRVAITLHHHMPTFHNSHCVYAHLLSEGADYRTCGRPCEAHRVALRDFAGHEHPVVVDVSCRNTVFNAQAQSAAPLVPELLRCGVRRFRVEFVWERGPEVRRTLGAYRALLAGEVEPQHVLQEVAVHERYGVTALSSRARP